MTTKIAYICSNANICIRENLKYYGNIVITWYDSDLICVEFVQVFRLYFQNKQFSRKHFKTCDFIARSPVLLLTFDVDFEQVYLIYRGFIKVDEK